MTRLVCRAAAILRRLALGALLGWSVSIDQIEGGVDEADVRKALRKIADQSSADGIVFFRKKSYVVAQRKQRFKHALRICGAAEHDVGIGEPERAGQERSLFAFQAVVDLLGCIAPHQAIAHELVLYGFHRALETIVLRIEKSHLRHQQQRRIEGLAASILHERVARRIEAGGANHS